ncbi:hypothetical protein ABZP36_012973 [Zizania latifolia]
MVTADVATDAASTGVMAVDEATVGAQASSALGMVWTLTPLSYPTMEDEVEQSVEASFKATMAWVAEFAMRALAWSAQKSEGLRHAHQLYLGESSGVGRVMALEAKVEQLKKEHVDLMVRNEALVQESADARVEDNASVVVVEDAQRMSREALC